MMMVVFSAIYSVFDMSLRVFSFGNNKVEAVESARVGMEKMEREIRRRIFTNAASPTRITCSSIRLTQRAANRASDQNPAHLRQRPGANGDSDGVSHAAPPANT